MAATFSVSRVSAIPLVNDADPSTSLAYVHRSGHDRRRKREEQQDMYTEEDEDDEMADVDHDGDGAGIVAGHDAATPRLTTTGKAIASATTFMRGHGTYLSTAASSSSSNANAEPVIRSALCGVVRKTNKLISVASLKTRYAPEVGDLVVGRINDVQSGNRKWKVDIQARQEANLLLSSINLPGGIQRRKLESDELEMRTFFKEGDLLVCEVQSLFHDGSTSLHTRSLNYGKLRNGQLAIVNPCLIRRLKSHFVRMEDAGLEIIIGLNGVIWVSMLNTGKVNVTTGTGRDIEAIYSDQNDVVPLDVRQRISRMLDIIALLSSRHCPISDIGLAQGFHASLRLAPLASDSAADDEGQRLTEEAGDNDDSEMTPAICLAILDHVRSTLAT